MAIALDSRCGEVVQRWRDRRGLYRPAREVIRTADFDVVRVRQVAPLKAFIIQHHYAGSNSQITRAFELRGTAGRLVGCATFGEVARQFTPYDSGSPDGWLCLTRLVLLDEVAANGESWMVARCFDELRREGFAGVVSYSDPVPRVAMTGDVVLRGHVGTVYAALNGIYLGRTKPETKWLLPDGSVFESRAAQKIATADKGAGYGERILVAHGATPLRRGEDAAAWVRRWRERLCRPLYHSGNHRYQWALDKRLRRHLVQTAPYPKLVVTDAPMAVAA